MYDIWSIRKRLDKKVRIINGVLHNDRKRSNNTRRNK